MAEDDQVTDPLQFSQQCRDNREVSHTASYATFSRRRLDQKYQPAPKLVLMPLPLVTLGLKVDHVNLAPGMTGLIALIQVCRVYETYAIAF
jgi:hypothetical protein